MASLQELEAELQRRGAFDAQQSAPDLQSIKTELKRRGAIPEIPESKEFDAPTPVGELPEVFKGFLNIKGGGVLGEAGFLDRLKILPALLTATKPEEFAKIVTSNFPNVKTETRDGSVLLINKETGEESIINSPGLSKTDIIQGIGIGAAFAPAGKFASGGKNLLTKALRAIPAAAATETALQSSQAAVGGDFDRADVGISAALGPIGEFGAAGLGATAKGLGAAFRAPGVASRASRAQVPEEAQSIIDAGVREKVPVLTTDILEPKTAAGKFAQQTAEKIPIAGTGGIRAAQQEARVEAVERLGSDFGVGLDTPLEKQMIASLLEAKNFKATRAVRLRTEAVDELVPFGDVPIENSKKVIADQIEELSRLTTRAPTALIKSLEDISNSLKGDFRLIKDIRTTVNNDISNLQKGQHTVLASGDEVVLGKVKTAISKDLENFAENHSKDAARKWRKSNSQFAEAFTKFRRTELKRILEKGELTPEAVAPILRGGKRSELVRLRNNMTEDGRKAARAAIVRDILLKTKFPEVINPNAVAAAFSTPSVKQSVKVFFKEPDRNQLNGLIKLLNSTKRAQEAPVTTQTGQALVPLVAFGGGAANPISTFMGAATLSASARAYESASFRNFLIKLNTLPEGGRAFNNLISKFKPLAQPTVQQIRER